MKNNFMFFVLSFFVLTNSFCQLRAVDYSDTALFPCKDFYKNRWCFEQKYESLPITKKEKRNDFKKLKVLQQFLSSQDTGIVKFLIKKHWNFSVNKRASNDTVLKVITIYGEIFDFDLKVMQLGSYRTKGLTLKKYKKIKCVNEGLSGRYIDIDFFIKEVKPRLKYHFIYYCHEVYVKLAYGISIYKLKEAKPIPDIERDLIGYF